MSAAAGAVTVATVALAPIQMFWFGRPLGDVERLSIRSFQANGHEVHLYAYEPLDGVPDGTVIRDAREVMSYARFEELRARGVKPGPIADIFRYALLFEHGGWWSDCDVVCVKPWDFTSDIVFGWQDERVANQAVLRLPAGHDAARRLTTLMAHPNRWMRGDPPRRILRKTRDAVLGRRTADAITWGATGPAAITTVVTGERLLHRGLSAEVFYPVPWTAADVLFAPGRLPLSSATYAVHLWNEVRRGRDPESGSPLATWMERYGVR
ncbi:hypothetical protein KZX37_04380 [Microbacterium sp. EYE_5]|uniref:glycosyltransferase n=1 Tax=unclassified Microbacterium TaxID=2609290 RepID=UPI002003D49A|nr:MULTISPECIES: glycosyltransferase [unclassified Microbacterium]MCK6079856.1 hypothetical protein [Microbacterium sp. EYE_382]MCK6085127.1 hypothetical protein [Microbacterium sp. EYE_384]MCK6122647.1 hypothetical protein [Microbacterium sp. EYE_80]MCK6125890.1 hypothetical protein [Microbacterium sp. EYE_79]MCK6140811.1 hypothetical protein [Microbacterium sp. EYE_39]